MEHPVTHIFVLITLLLTAGHSRGAESTESPTGSPTDSGDNDFSENLGAGSMPTKEQKLVIDIHNEVRRRVVATNMNIVVSRSKNVGYRFVGCFIYLFIYLFLWFCLFVYLYICLFN